MGLFLRDPSLYLRDILEKITENSEWLGRQARPGFEPGTSRLPVLSVTAVPLVGPSLQGKLFEKTLHFYYSYLVSSYNLSNKFFSSTIWIRLVKVLFIRRKGEFYFT